MRTKGEIEKDLGRLQNAVAGSSDTAFEAVARLRADIAERDDYIQRVDAYVVGMREEWNKERMERAKSYQHNTVRWSRGHGDTGTEGP